jgi:hypothetical protein
MGRPLPKCLNRGADSALVGPLGVAQDAVAVAALGALELTFAAALVLRRLPAAAGGDPTPRRTIRA